MSMLETFREQANMLGDALRANGSAAFFNKVNKRLSREYLYGYGERKEISHKQRAKKKKANRTSRASKRR